MSELFPVLAGLVSGVLLALLRPSARLPIGIGLAITLGAMATIVSGEFRVSWEYLLVDIPLVAVSAAAGYVGVRVVVKALKEGG